MRENVLWIPTAQAWLPLAGFVLTLALAIFVISRRPRSPVHRAFAALNAAAALWNLDVFLLFTLQDREVAGALDRIFQIPIVTIPWLGLLFIFLFLGRRATHPLVVLFGIWTVILWGVSLSPNYLSGWDRYWFGYYGRAGDWYLLFPLTHVAYLVISTLYLHREVRRTPRGIRRTQTASILAANLVFGLFSFDNFRPLFGGGRLPVGNVAALFYFAIITVTIVRFRLFDIRVLFRYGVLYSSLTFVLSGIYLLMVLGLQGWFQVEVFSGSIALPMVPALAVAFAFGPVRKALQERLDRSFFRSRGLMRSRLAEFSATARRAEREEEVWDAAWEGGWRLVNPEKAALLSAGPDRFRTLFSVGCRPGELDGICPVDGEAGSGPELPAGFDVLVPVRGGEGLLGACLLGPKLSGDPYCVEDEEFLRGIAGQCALALERVRLLEEGRRKERLAAFGQCAAIVSHEMRNPLSTMRGALELLRSRMNRREGGAIVSILDEEVRRAGLFVEDFLSACREPRPHLRRVNLNDLVEEFVARWNGAGRGVTFDPCPGELPVQADFSQMSRVLNNIAGNAHELSPAGCKVRIATAAVDGGASLTVEDDGPGIPEELLPKIFEPFCTARRNGTGLGLSIVRGIVEAHGGKIEARNRRFGGAAFTVRLPAPPGEAGGGDWRNDRRQEGT